jgi:hypothetical protein
MITHRLYRYSSQRKSKVAEEVLATLNAYKLAELGARTHTIISLTSLSERKVKDIIRDVTGANPKPGRVVTTLLGFIKSKYHRLQASVLVSDYVRAIKLGFNETEAFIQAYTNYLALYPEAEKTRNFIDVDQAHRLVRETTLLKTFSLVECQSCHCNILRDNSEMFSRIDCPICSAAAEQVLPIMPEHRQYQAASH